MNPDTPWDVKTLCLSLGGTDDERGFIGFEIFDDQTFNIYEGGDSGAAGEGARWRYEGIDLEAARRLRDFLNYAVPDRSADVHAASRTGDGRPEERLVRTTEADRRQNLVATLYPTCETPRAARRG